MTLAKPAPRDAAPHRPRFLGWALLGFAVLLITLGAARPLSVPDEGRYAEISRWMLVSRDWLIPRLNGLPWFRKPPLLHWLEAGSMAVFGAHDWAVRLPGILLALAMLAVGFVAVRRLADARVARTTFLMLGLNIGLLVGAPYVNYDLLIAAWIALAVWCFALALQEDATHRTAWALAGFAACALGVLTKGLIGAVLPGMVLFVWVSWARRWRLVARLPWVRGVALFALIALPWFVVAARHYPELWSYMFGTQQFARYTASSARFHNHQPAWFFAAVLPLMLLPWSVFALRSGAAALPRPTAREPALRSLCWIWVLVLVAFFSVPRSKSVGYILPALPPLATLAALGWERVMGARRHAWRWFALLAALPLALAAVLTALAPRLDKGDARAVAALLRHQMAPGDRVLVAHGYPFDLAFGARLRHPLLVVTDGDHTAQGAGDTWERSLQEAGRFAPAAAARVLLPPSALVPQACTPGRWLVIPVGSNDPPGWERVAGRRYWTLYRSLPNAPACVAQKSESAAQPR